MKMMMMFFCVMDEVVRQTLTCSRQGRLCLVLVVPDLWRCDMSSQTGSPSFIFKSQNVRRMRATAVWEGREGELV